MPVVSEVFRLSTIRIDVPAGLTAVRFPNEQLFNSACFIEHTVCVQEPPLRCLLLLRLFLS